MPRLVFVLLDGLTADTARRCLSCPVALEEAGEARYCELNAELPPLSRPVYATLAQRAQPDSHRHSAQRRRPDLPGAHHLPAGPERRTDHGPRPRTIGSARSAIARPLSPAGIA